MKTAQLIKAVDSFDSTLVLIEFPDVGGPFRSPGLVQVFAPTADTVIESNYPRSIVTKREFLNKLLSQDPDGIAELFLDNVYYDIDHVRHHRSGRCVLVAGEVRHPR